MRTDELWWARQRSSLAQAYADEDTDAVAARLRDLLSAVRGDPPDEVVPDNVVAFLDAAHLLAESGNLPRSHRAWRLALYALH
ncbi:hypothetical protein [Longimicrobium sp.]|uniref:hypothetical protein n=1 Tax=Longimicrobium sp. TaxID=2029185 RepID=UPI002C76E616|nr:hypothetical protein [Longimicrobium sp.]HSU17988.1 hypothetical protein [Longimicrobium sp.]